MDSVKIVAGDLMEQVKVALSAEGTEFADMNWDTRNAEQIMGLITPELLCQLEALRAQGFEEIWDNHLRELLNIENVLEMKSCEALHTDDLVAEFRAQGFEPALLTTYASLALKPAENQAAVVRRPATRTQRATRQPERRGQAARATSTRWAGAHPDRGSAAFAARWATTRRPARRRRRAD